MLPVAVFIVIVLQFVVHVVTFTFAMISVNISVELRTHTQISLYINTYILLSLSVGANLLKPYSKRSLRLYCMENKQTVEKVFSFGKTATAWEESYCKDVLTKWMHSKENDSHWVLILNFLWYSIFMHFIELTFFLCILWKLYTDRKYTFQQLIPC